ncbi:MAG: hypothetical protein ACFFEO_04250 [Candidatus Thorarchaeota archaeon]
MIDFVSYYEEINRKIKKLKMEMLSGKLSLLSFELDPIFQDLKDSLNTYNIDNYSALYKEACFLLNQKFEELKSFLKLLENDKLFFNFLDLNPSDQDISLLFNGCWRMIFNIETISINFLAESDKRYSKERNKIIQVEHLKRQKVNSEFLLEIAHHNFTEKMSLYFEKIKSKLPCKFEDIFENDKDQGEIFENFVYLLHLLQLNKIKYQKETESLYM